MSVAGSARKLPKSLLNWFIESYITYISVPQYCIFIVFISHPLLRMDDVSSKTRLHYKKKFVTFLKVISYLLVLRRFDNDWSFWLTRTFRVVVNS